jgi:hypothetical protein
MVCIKARETSQHRLPREQLMLCNRAGKPGPEAIIAREFLITFGGPKVIQKTLMSRFSL